MMDLYPSMHLGVLPCRKGWHKAALLLSGGTVSPQHRLLAPCLHTAEPAQGTGL